MALVSINYCYARIPNAARRAIFVLEIYCSHLYAREAEVCVSWLSNSNKNHSVDAVLITTLASAMPRPPLCTYPQLTAYTAQQT